jgi:hypothetical protein
MNQFKASRQLLSVLIICLAGVCHADWATTNKNIPIMKDVISQLSSSQNQVAQLTKKQIPAVVNSLAGPVKRSFESDNLLPTIFVYWGKTAGQIDKSKIYFVRYPAKGDYFSLLGVTPDGQIFESSSGRVENGRVPASFELNLP